MIAQMSSHHPVPVGAKAITPAVPNPQNKPRECREKESYKVPFSESWKNPAEGVKKNQ